jgi:hypothetical protein
VPKIVLFTCCSRFSSPKIVGNSPAEIWGVVVGVDAAGKVMAIANDASATPRTTFVTCTCAKKDVLNDLKQHVPERQVPPVEAQATPAEEQMFERIDSHRTATQLF